MKEEHKAPNGIINKGSLGRPFAIFFFSFFDTGT
jgi:hypothetical protein